VNVKPRYESRNHDFALFYIKKLSESRASDQNQRQVSGRWLDQLPVHALGSKRSKRLAEAIERNRRVLDVIGSIGFGEPRQSDSARFNYKQL
jgi:hypothetical protein